MADEVVARVARPVGVGLGHAVADGRPALGEALLDPGDHLGRHGRPAAAHRREAGGVEVLEAGRLEHVPALRGHADERGDPLALDDLERPLGVPAVHHHQLHARREARQHHRHQAGDVEQRHDQDQDRRRGLAGRCRAPRPGAVRRGLARPLDGDPAAEAHERLGDGPVGRHRPLGPPGGAGRVQDHHVVVGAGRLLGHRRPQREHVLPPLDALGHLAVAQPHAEEADAPALARRRRPVRPARGRRRRPSAPRRRGRSRARRPSTRR